MDKKQDKNPCLKFLVQRKVLQDYIFFELKQDGSIFLAITEKYATTEKPKAIINIPLDKKSVLKLQKFLNRNL